MTDEQINLTYQVMLGATATAYAVAALFFLRFWRDTRDRLFLFFAVALFVLAVNRVAFAIADGGDEGRGGGQYWVRLAAFGMILAAIVDKNRPRSSAG